MDRSLYWKLYPAPNDWEPTRRRRGLFVCSELKGLGWRISNDSAEGCSIVVLQRIATPDEVRNHQSAGRVVLFETNDCNVLRGTRFWIPSESETVETADYCVVSSRWMQRIYGRINPRCLVAPEALEDDLWSVPTSDIPDSPLVLSWHGLGDNVRIYLDPLIRQIGPIPNVRLRLVTNGFDSRRRSNRDLVKEWPIPTELVEWTLDTFAFEMTRAHAGIVLLPATTFASGKGPHKALAYFCGGLPVIASNVPPYREVIEDGVTGLLAETPEEFRAGIEKLRDPDLRKRIGEAGREFSRHFRIENIGRLWDRLLTKCLDERAA